MRILIVGPTNPLDFVTIREIVKEKIEENGGRVSSARIRFNSEEDVFVTSEGKAINANGKAVIFVLPSLTESLGRSKEAVDGVVRSLSEELHECKVVLARKFPS